MKTYYKLFFLALFLGLIPLSCERCDPNTCECESNTPVANFDITKLGLQTLNPETLVALDTSQVYDVDSISKALTIDTYDRVFSSNSSLDVFTLQAYACSPVGSHVLQDIQSFEIISRTTFTNALSTDTTFSGDDITKLFTGRKSYNHDAYQTIEYSRNLYRLWYPDEKFIVKLKPIIINPLTLKFDVKVTLTDGQVFEFKDEILKVK